MARVRIQVAAGRYSEDQRAQVMGLRRDLEALKKTRSLLVSRRSALIERLKTETTATPKKMLQRDIALIRDQLQEQSTRKAAIISMLDDLRVASIIGE